jgi:hypothetical protein
MDDGLARSAGESARFLMLEEMVRADERPEDKGAHGDPPPLVPIQQRSFEVIGSGRYSCGCPHQVSENPGWI